MHIYSTGVIYDHHLRSSKYVYNTGHWILNGNLNMMIFIIQNLAFLKFKILHLEITFWNILSTFADNICPLLLIEYWKSHLQEFHTWPNGGDGQPLRPGGDYCPTRGDCCPTRGDRCPTRGDCCPTRGDCCLPPPQTIESGNLFELRKRHHHLGLKFSIWLQHLVVWSPSQFWVLAPSNRVGVVCQPARTECYKTCLSVIYTFLY